MLIKINRGLTPEEERCGQGITEAEFRERYQVATPMGCRDNGTPLQGATPEKTAVCTGKVEGFGEIACRAGVHAEIEP